MQLNYIQYILQPINVEKPCFVPRINLYDDCLLEECDGMAWLREMHFETSSSITSFMLFDAPLFLTSVAAKHVDLCLLSLCFCRITLDLGTLCHNDLDLFFRITLSWTCADFWAILAIFSDKASLVVSEGGVGAFSKILLLILAILRLAFTLQSLRCKNECRCFLAI